MSNSLHEFLEETNTDVLKFVNRSENIFDDEIIKDKEGKYYYVNKYAVIKRIDDTAISRFQKEIDNGELDDTSFKDIDLDSKSVGDSFDVVVTKYGTDYKQNFIMGTPIVNDKHQGHLVGTYFHISKTGTHTNNKMGNISLISDCMQFTKKINETISTELIDNISPDECKQLLIDSDNKYSFSQSNNGSNNIKCYLTKDSIPNGEGKLLGDDKCPNGVGDIANDSYRATSNDSQGIIDNFNKLGYMDSDSKFKIIEDNKVGNSKSFVTVQQRRFAMSDLSLCELSPSDNCRANCQNDPNCDGLVYKDENNERSYYTVGDKSLFSDLTKRIYDANFGILMKGKELIKEGFASFEERSTLQTNRLIASNGGSDNGIIRHYFNGDILLGELQESINAHTAINEFLVKNIKRKVNEYGRNKSVNSALIDTLKSYDTEQASSMMSEIKESSLKLRENQLNAHYETTHNTLWVGLFIFSLILLFKIIR